jgi:aminopeptidase N
MFRTKFRLQKIKFMKSLTTVFLLLFISTVLTAQSPAYNPQINSIDVQHYRFSLTLKDDTDRIEGQAEITLRFKQAGNSFMLDLTNVKSGKGMTVSAVSYNNTALKFSHTDDHLSITLPNTIPTSENITVTVQYAGVPADGLIIDANKFGDRTFFGDNWPNRAHHWLPTIDHPSDKASVEFLVTAPDHYQVVGNGIQIEESNLDGGLRRTHWKETVLLPTKVMVIGVAPFAVQLAGEVQGIQVSSWVFPDNRAEGFTDYSQAVEVLEWFHKNIAPYPYRKLANVQSKTRYGGMENASNIFYYENSVNGKKEREDLIAHEIAHQWFGNSASEANWYHVWLSEGFATYSTHLYHEAKYGAASLAERMRKDRFTVVRYAEGKLAPIVDTTVTDINDVLNTNSYQKGSWVLHMLRHEIGDTAFWKGYRAYYQKYQGSNALTVDFQKVMEEASGKSLQTFFRQWIFQAGQPELKASYRYDGGEKIIVLTVQQLQKSPFSFPLDIQFLDENKKVILEKTLSISKAEEEFDFPVEGFPKSIKLDPKAYLLFK